MRAGPDALRQRRHILFTMLTACAWHDAPAGPAPVVAALRTFLGGWLGIGRIVVGMARQSYELQLTRYGEEGWRATFYPAGPVVSAWQPKLWIVVRREARENPRKGKRSQREERASAVLVPWLRVNQLPEAAR
jgi:hypothetical protein